MSKRDPVQPSLRHGKAKEGVPSWHMALQCTEAYGEEDEDDDADEDVDEDEDEDDEPLPDSMTLEVCVVKETSDDALM